MTDLSLLPGIDRWGVRRIERAINVDTAGGALIGVLLTPPLLLVARVVAGVVRRSWGYPWGYAGFALGWLLAGYLALVLLANWSDLDGGEDADS